VPLPDRTNVAGRRLATGSAATLLFCGDTFLRTGDGADPFAPISPCFAGSHVCLNLETALSGGKVKQKNVALHVAEKTLDLLPDNVQFVNIVNNHAADGAAPIRLLEALHRRNKEVVGPQNPSQICVSIDGRRVAFLSAYFPLPRARMSYGGRLARGLESLIRSSSADRVVVNLHWGYEHTDFPAPFQRALARRLVDAGADLIVGHHPHVPQGWEVYRGSAVYYSLGNFNFRQFDTETTEKNRWGYMVRYDPKSGGSQPIPYRINENYQPVPAFGREKAELLDRLERLSQGLESMDGPTWFADHYRKWFSREFRVWKRRCLQGRRPGLMLKWMVWLLLPMQLRFYGHAAGIGRFVPGGREG